MTILFWLRKNQINRKGQCPIWCSISIHQSKSEFSCKVSVDPLLWNQRTQRATGLHSDYINAQLEQITAKLLELKITLQAQGKTITVQLLKDAYLKKTVTQPTFLQMYQSCLERKQTNLSPIVRRRYSNRLKEIEQFLKLHRKETILPEEFTAGLLEELRYYLRTEKNIQSQEYLYRYLDSIREVLRYCEKKQIPINTDALNFDMRKGKPKTPLYLSAEQIAQLGELTAHSETIYLAKALDLALFQRYTGFAYVDLMSFEFEKDTILSNGRRWIRKARNKSGEMALLPLFNEAEAILKKHDYRLPKISNQKYNVYLGAIGEMIGLPFKLTSHIMRKTAGALWLQEGIPYAMVSGMLGHASITTTQRHYVRVDISAMQSYFK